LNPAEPSIQFEEYNEPVILKWRGPVVCGGRLTIYGNDADDPDQEQYEYDQGSQAADSVEPIPAGICGFDIRNLIRF